jgi:hypothetical protein
VGLPRLRVAAVALLVPAVAVCAGAQAATRPRLVSAQLVQRSLTLRWSAAVRVARGRPSAAFTVRAADGSPVHVRALHAAGSRALTLTLSRTARVSRVRYRAASRLLHDAAGRNVPAAALTVRAGAASERTPPPRPPAPVPTPVRTPVATPAPTPAPTTPSPPPGPGAESWTALSTPIDSAQQTLLPFGARSFWLQPWRAYLDTVPGTTLRDALGINFNLEPDQAARTAHLLAAAGVRRARVEFGFNSVRYDDPSSLANPGRFDAILQALKDNGIRPLLLLNANHDEPTPVLRQTLTLAANAPAGATSIHFTPDSVGAIVPGRTGFDRADGKAADVLITAVQPDGTGTLSKPLPSALPAGPVATTTLRYAPFAAPDNADGTPNASFEDTLAGWLRYVGAVTSRARADLGGDDFDVEIWNEVSFGSDFLDAHTYYTTLPAALTGTGDVQRALLERTVAWLRDPAHGVSGIGIGDGFASETPWPSGATEPAGVTAIDKHPYASVRDYPADAQANTTGVGPDGTPTTWSPNLRAFFPEYWLSGLQTETLIRDLAPDTESVYGTPHGRLTAPGGGGAPQMWITEAGMDLADGRLPQSELTPAAKRHILTKGVLRSLVAHVNKGVTALDFYAARGDVYGLVDEGFYAGGADGGETVDALARLMAPFEAAQPLSRPRALTLRSIADDHDHVQFAGDGTAAHPPLYDRDVVAVLPFQLADDRFAIPAYVMTRDLTHLYAPSAPRDDVTRWDMPPERFRIALGGLSPGVRLSAQDPLTGQSVPVTVVSRAPDQVVIELPLTDSPRIILADDG